MTTANLESFIGDDILNPKICAVERKTQRLESSDSPIWRDSSSGTSRHYLADRLPTPPRRARNVLVRLALVPVCLHGVPQPPYARDGHHTYPNWRTESWVGAVEVL